MPARRPRAPLVALPVALALALAGCGGGEDRPELVVFAAASLAPAFERYAEGFEPAEVRLSFAGSDELAAQIRQGLVPDLYAAADTELPAALAAEGLLAEPTTFAANELVLAVPAGSMVDGLAEIGATGVAVGVGDPDVPVGGYTRELLDRLDPELAAAIRANVRTSEPDVSGIVGKLSQGAIDAGFVYASDVVAAGVELRAIELPKRLRPAVAYGVGVTTEAEHPAAAQRFVAGLLEGPGAEALGAAGLEPAAEAGAGR